MELNATVQVHQRCKESYGTMRVLITGITGMVGSFLAEYLLDSHPEVEVFGVPEEVCNVDKFTTATGWRPSIPFETTLGDLLDYWRQRVVKRPARRLARVA
jgi:nucleoside-diphosphate-sugar epimerase